MTKVQKSAALSVLLLVLLVAWFIPRRTFGLTGNDLWLVRGGIALLGVAGIGVWVMLASRKKKPGAGGATAGQPGAADQVDGLIAESNQRLAGLGKGAKLTTMPAILVLGDPGSAKTSTVLNSGLEAELLAGQAMQDGATIPTRGVNFWLARQSVFVDLSGAACADPEVRARLAKRMAPSTSAFSKGEQAPRAAVVCVDIE